MDQHPSSYLKSLSQKKYAWMEAATTPISPDANHNAAAESNNASARAPSDNESSRPHKKSRTKKILDDLPDLTSIQKPTQQSASTTAPTSPTSPKERKRIQQPHFKYTTFPIKGFNILPTRNIISSFARTDDTYFPGNKLGDPSIAPLPESEWQDTVIIHPGSRNLRIGLASGAFPKTVPHVIARRMRTSPTTTVSEDTTVVPMDLNGLHSDDNSNSDSTSSSPIKRVVDAESLGYNHEETLHELRNELKWRMKNAKRRAVANAESQVVSFNSQEMQETIPDHNDPYKVEWTDVPDTHPPEFFIGDKALNLPLETYPDYQLRYPWKYGSFNYQDYSSIEAVLSDLQTIWTETIQTELEIEDKTFENYNVVLVIPDLFHRRYTCELLTMLLCHMKFRGALVHQEPACTTYGAGISSACVVDIGAQKTAIRCIDDGVCIADSRVFITVGGDDITNTFASFLLSNRFPYADIGLSQTYNQRLADELKMRWCTMNEAEINVQVYDFFIRQPHQSTKKYQCKVYDEVFLAPLCLFYPSILDKQKKIHALDSWANNDVLDDITEEPSVTPQVNVQSWVPNKPPVETSSELSATSGRATAYDIYPLDVAIAQSIKVAAGASDERLKRLFANIILVGGGGMINNFSRVLEDRVLSTVIAQAASIERVEVLPPPRDLDPQILAWKGASVLCKLETAKEMWIGPEEWQEPMQDWYDSAQKYISGLTGESSLERHEQE